MATQNELEIALRRLAEEVAARAGVELVDLSLRGPFRHRLLRVDIDRAGPSGVTVDDCQRVSEALGTALDESDLIPSKYVLEVTSPGLDRPIRSADDIRRNTGRRVVVTAAEPDNANRSIHGLLLGAEDGYLRIGGPGQAEIRISLDNIVSARQEIDL